VTTAPPPDTTAGLAQADLDSGGGAVRKQAPPPEMRSNGTLRAEGLGIAAGGVVLLGTGIVFGVLAGKDADDVSGATKWTSTLQSTQSAGQRDSTLAGVGIGLGAAAIAAGVTMYVLGMREHPVEVAITPHSTEVTWAIAW
jgi:hypothetical protein